MAGASLTSWLTSVDRHSPVVNYQILAVPSGNAVTSKASSGENAAGRTVPSSRQTSVDRHSPVMQSPILAVPPGNAVTTKTSSDVRSADAVKTKTPSDENAAEETTLPAYPASVDRHSPVMDFQILDVLLANTVTIKAPSNKNSTNQASLPIPASVERHSPAVEFQILAVPPVNTVTPKAPAHENSGSQTFLLSSASVGRHSPVGEFQILAVRSCDCVTTKAPAGEQSGGPNVSPVPGKCQGALSSCGMPDLGRAVSRRRHTREPSGEKAAPRAPLGRHTSKHKDAGSDTRPTVVSTHVQARECQSGDLTEITKPWQSAPNESAYSTRSQPPESESTRGRAHERGAHSVAAAKGESTEWPWTGQRFY